MFLQESNAFKFKQKYQEIIAIGAAHENTYVVFFKDNEGYYRVTHIDSNGMILYDYLSLGEIRDARFIKSSQLVFLQQKLDQIVILDLEKQTVKQLAHKYQSFAKSQLHILPESNSICIAQITQQLKLSFYRPNEYPEPYHVYTSTVEQWKKGFKIHKFNNHSSFGWCPNEWCQQVTISIYDLQQKNHFRKFTLQTTNMNSLYYKIRAFWQLKKDLFFLVVVLKDNTVGLIATGSGECTQFEGDVSGNSTLQWCRMQNYSKLVIIEDFTNWTRVFYVCNDNGKIIHQQKFENHFVYLSIQYDTHGIFEIEKPVMVSNFMKFVCIGKKICDFEQYIFRTEPLLALSFMLLELNHQFDDDLLRDAVELIDPQSAK